MRAYLSYCTALVDAVGPNRSKHFANAVFLLSLMSFALPGYFLVQDFKTKWILRSYEFNEKKIPLSVLNNVFVKCDRVDGVRDSEGFLIAVSDMQYQVINDSSIDLVIRHPSATRRLVLNGRPKLEDKSGRTLPRKGPPIPGRFHAGIVPSWGSLSGSLSVSSLDLPRDVQTKNGYLAFHLVQGGERWSRTKSECRIPIYSK